jgi:hypothetical protein
MSDFGFVYILKSDDEEDVYKIGFTKRAPSSRLKQINDTCPDSNGFSLFCYAEFEDPKTVESFIHKKLNTFRIPSTELFKGPSFIFVSYLYFHENWASFSECTCLPEIKIPLEELPNPYMEDGYVF